MKKSIAFVHLLNDFSGSPRVLRTVITGTIENGNDACIITSSGTGFLSNLPKADYQLIPYKYSNMKLLTLIRYFIWQVRVFLKVLRLPKQYETIYINTMHPFGAALAGVIRNNTIIYHIHETSLKPVLLKKWLRLVIQKFAKKIIYVSNYLKERENFPNKNIKVLYNSLSDDFNEISFSYKSTNKFTVLMLCSLKKYKGINEFIRLSKMLPDIQFNLVVNATKDEIEEYFNHEVNLPNNCYIFPSTKDVHEFYKNSNLVLNLSHRDEWIETFGLTVSEAFSYGIPVIVPEVGGIAEIVEHGVNGYRFNHDKLVAISETILRLSKDNKLYSTLQINAYLSTRMFDSSTFKKKIAEELNT